MRYVYLAGPIAGLTEDEAKDWRRYVRERLGPCIRGISPLRCEPIEGEVYGLKYTDPCFGTPAAIYHKNRYDTLCADVVLAYLPEKCNRRRLSIGTIMEISLALDNNKWVITVSDDPQVIDHPWIRFTQVVPTLDMALLTINSALDAYTY